jgi:hypothetical protein
MNEERPVLCDVSFEPKKNLCYPTETQTGGKKGTSIFWLVFSLYLMLWLVENPTWRFVC